MVEAQRVAAAKTACHLDAGLPSANEALAENGATTKRFRKIALGSRDRSTQKMQLKTTIVHPRNAARGLLGSILNGI